MPLQPGTSDALHQSQTELKQRPRLKEVSLVDPTRDFSMQAT